MDKNTPPGDDVLESDKQCILLRSFWRQFLSWKSWRLPLCTVTVVMLAQFDPTAAPSLGGRLPFLFPVSCFLFPAWLAVLLKGWGGGALLGEGKGQWRAAKRSRSQLCCPFARSADKTASYAGNDSLVISIKTAERHFPTLLFSTMVLFFCDCHQNPKARLLILLCCVLVFQPWLLSDLQCCRVTPISEHEERFIGKAVDDKIAGWVLFVWLQMLKKWPLLSNFLIWCPEWLYCVKWLDLTMLRDTVSCFVINSTLLIYCVIFAYF